MSLGRSFVRNSGIVGRTFASATRQSPIDLKPEEVHAEIDINLSTQYRDIENGKLNLDGRALITYYDGGNMNFKSYHTTSEWQSLQFHFHAPSEHTIDGKYYDAEMHMVFQGITHKEELAVVGILFEACEDAPKDQFLESLQLHKLAQPSSETEIAHASPGNLFDRVGSDENFHYQGSLTTPDYDECVQWFVFDKPLKVPPSQIKDMEEFWSDMNCEGCVQGNARHLQTVGSRVVHKVKHTCKGRVS